MKKLFLLDNSGINEAVTAVSELLSGHVTSQERINVTILLEEALLNYQKSLPGEEFALSVRKKLGIWKVSVRIKGPAINPFTDETSLLSKTITENIRHAESFSYSIDYFSGANTVTFHVFPHKRQIRIPGGKTTAALLLGILVAVVCRFLPAPVRDFAFNGLAAPVSKVLLKLLSGIMGPVIFLSVVSSIISFDDLKSLFESLGRTLRLFFGLTMATILTSAAVNMLIFHVQFGSSGEVNLYGLVELILGIIPLNCFTPFVENNVVQIVVLAFFIGHVMVALGDRFNVLDPAIREMSRITMRMLHILNRLSPGIIFLSVLSFVANIEAVDFFSMGKLILSMYLSLLLSAAILLLFYRLRTKSSISALLRESQSVLFKSFTMGSGTAVVNDLFEMADNMGIKEPFSRFCIPVGVTFSSTGNTICLVTGAVFTAVMTDTPIDIMWLFLMVLFSFILTITTPGGTGGVIVTYSVMMTQLGMPLTTIEVLGTAHLFYFLLVSTHGTLTRIIGLVVAAKDNPQKAY